MSRGECPTSHNICTDRGSKAPLPPRNTVTDCTRCLLVQTSSITAQRQQQQAMVL